MMVISHLRMVRNLAVAGLAMLVTFGAAPPARAANELSFDWSED